MSTNRLHILSSGSKGNAVLIESDGHLLLIDQGLSFRRFRQRCAQLGIDPAAILAIAISHEHIDHVNGVPLTARELGVPVYAASAVIDYLTRLSRYPFEALPLRPDAPARIGPFLIEPFPVIHDAREPYGFSLTFPNRERLTIVTDTGMVTQRIFAQLADSEYIVIEANHDPGMLYRNPRYPADLKQRIRGAKGHLSNEQCLEILGKLNCTRLKKVVFAHLSEENNSPALLRHFADECIFTHRLTVDSFIASQEEPLSIDLS